MGVVLYMIWMRFPVGGYLTFYTGCVLLTLVLAIAGGNIGRFFAPQSFALITGRWPKKTKYKVPGVFDEDAMLASGRT